MKLAFKYRFYPTKEQTNLLNRTFGCVRYVYNFGLALRRDAYDEHGERLRTTPSISWMVCRVWDKIA